MIKYVLALLFTVSILNAQTTTEEVQAEVKVGDVFEIGDSELRTYKHIKFPRANFIIKRGGIANYSSAKGEVVVVTSIEETKEGHKKAVIKRKDGGRFFGSHKYVKANIEKALASGELNSI